MPIWLRKFTFSKIQAFYEEENEKTESANQAAKQSIPKIKKPNYNVKAPTK